MAFLLQQPFLRLNAARKFRVQFAVRLQQALEAGCGCVIDCAIDMDAMVHPMVGGGAPVTEFLLH